MTMVPYGWLLSSQVTGYADFWHPQAIRACQKLAARRRIRVTRPGIAPPRRAGLIQAH